MTRLLASWFGSGLILGRLRGSDAGSGTLASLVTLPISLLLGHYGGWAAQAGAAIVVAAAGLVVIRDHLEEGDAGWIVIDEAAGTFLATVGLVGVPALLAFAMFRLADIFKTSFPGVRRAEGLRGEWGIMTDDLVAALYGLAIGHLLLAVL